MQFSELPVGAKFRFHRRGLLRTKVSKTEYTDELGAQKTRAVPDTIVRPEEDKEPAPPTVAPKPDDVALLSKALDELEAKGGKTPELAEARQALRRLTAIVRLKIPDRG